MGVLSYLFCPTADLSAAGSSPEQETVCPSPFIQPWRYIPADLGGELTGTSLEHIDRYMSLNHFAPVERSEFLVKLSPDLAAGWHIQSRLDLYIFKSGIAVFSLCDDSFLIRKAQFAKDYGRSRREAHSRICSFEDPAVSLAMQKTLRALRQICALIPSSHRQSSKEDWESNGLSYVMTVSHFCTGLDPAEYMEMMKTDDTFVKSLKILLMPSLANEEDSFVCPLTDDMRDPYQSDLSDVELPHDYELREDIDVYISWAAVITSSREIRKDYVRFMDALEIDLQAMWMYTYCLLQDLGCPDTETASSLSLRKLRNQYLTRYNQFMTTADSSMPVYVSRIRNALIESSGLTEYKDQLIERLEYLIEDRTTEENQRQRKYGWLSEILLFIIAYLDILTTLFSLFEEQLTDGWRFFWITAAGIIFVSGIIFIIKKE